MKIIPFKIFLFPILLVVGGIFVQCSGPEEETGEYGPYRAEIKDWQQKRIERLKSETGWVNLAGLFWLDSSWRAMGYSETADFQVQYGSGPESILLARVRQDLAIEYMIPDGLNVFLDSSLVSGGQIFTDDEHLFSFANLRWFFIERDGFHAIRLRDLDHPKLNELPELKYFETSIDWRLEADFTAYEPPRIVEVPNVLGRTTKMTVIGDLSFTHEDQLSKLILFDGGPGLGFLIFADQTNGESTYGGGRYIYVDVPKMGDGKVVLDFNKAYSPPCEFTDYATCSFPPSENVLTYRVEAGEKSTFKH